MDRVVSLLFVGVLASCSSTKSEATPDELRGELPVLRNDLVTLGPHDVVGILEAAIAAPELELGPPVREHQDIVPIEFQGYEGEAPSVLFGLPVQRVLNFRQAIDGPRRVMILFSVLEVMDDRVRVVVGMRRVPLASYADIWMSREGGRWSVIEVLNTAHYL